MPATSPPTVSTASEPTGTRQGGGSDGDVASGPAIGAAGGRFDRGVRDAECGRPNRTKRFPVPRERGSVRPDLPPEANETRVCDEDPNRLAREAATGRRAPSRWIADDTARGPPARSVVAIGRPFHDANAAIPDVRGRQGAPRCVADVGARHRLRSRARPVGGPKRSTRTGEKGLGFKSSSWRTCHDSNLEPG